jgi:hypothetical protein
MAPLCALLGIQELQITKNKMHRSKTSCKHLSLVDILLVVMPIISFIERICENHDPPYLSLA